MYAARMPNAVKLPAPMSVMGTPTLAGGPPGKPVIDISPLIPWATRSNPPRLRYGPVPPKPDMLAYTSRGLISASAL